MRRLLLKAFLVLLAPAAAAADDKAVAEFYAKRTLTIAVGFSPGGNYDLHARLVARHIGKYIPGSPTIVVQNMPGAGSRRLANTLAKVGPHDGTMIGVPNQGIPMDQAIGADGVQFDARKFHWIGASTDEVNVLWAWHKSPVLSVEQAKQREMVVGATGPGSPTYFYPRIMNTLLGTKYKVVSGYPGSNELDFAIEREEVAGRIVGWSSLKITRDWVETRKAVVLVQMGLRRAPELAGVRLLHELATNEKDKLTLEFLSLAAALGRPFFMPPGTPPERVAAMRAAFAATMKDPAFLAEAKQTRLEVNPLSPADIGDIITKTFAAPSDVLATAKAAME